MIQYAQALILWVGSAVALILWVGSAVALIFCVENAVELIFWVDCALGHNFFELSCVAVATDPQQFRVTRIPQLTEQ